MGTFAVLRFNLSKWQVPGAGWAQIVAFAGCGMEGDALVLSLEGRFDLGLSGFTQCSRPEVMIRIL